MTARAPARTAALALLACCAGALAGAALVDDPAAAVEEPLRANGLGAPLELSACVRVGANTPAANASAQLQLGSGCAASDSTSGGSTGNATGNATAPAPGNATGNGTSAAPSAPSAPIDPSAPGGGSDGATPPEGSPSGEAPADAPAADIDAPPPPAASDGAAGAADNATSDTADGGGEAPSEDAPGEPAAANDPTTYTHRGWVPPNPRNNATNASGAAEGPAGSSNATAPDDHDTLSDGTPAGDDDGAASTSNDARANEAGPSLGAGGSGAALGPGAADGALGDGSGAAGVEDAISAGDVLWRPFEPVRVDASRAPAIGRDTASPCDPSCDATSTARRDADAWREMPRAPAAAHEAPRGLFARLVDSVRGYLAIPES